MLYKFIDDTKPLLLFIGVTQITTLNEVLKALAFVISISYTLYKFYKDFKNGQNN